MVLARLWVGIALFSAGCADESLRLKTQDGAQAESRAATQAQPRVVVSANAFAPGERIVVHFDGASPEFSLRLADHAEDAQRLEGKTGTVVFYAPAPREQEIVDLKIELLRQDVVVRTWHATVSGDRKCSEEGGTERRTRFFLPDPTCQSEEQTRICRGGTWQPWTPARYAFSSCGEPRTEERCSGGEEERIRFFEHSVPAGQSCRSETQRRRCAQGRWTSWSGTASAESCAVRPPRNCSGDAPHGERETRERHETAQVPYGQSCRAETQTRLCENGLWSAWSGTFSAETCAVETPRACSGSMAHGQTESRVRFERTGSTCAQETQMRTCDNGALSPWSGAFSAPSCFTGAAVSCTETRCEAPRMPLHGQLTQPVQLPDWACGPTAAVMVLDAFEAEGIPVDAFAGLDTGARVAQMERLMQTTVGTGTHYLKVVPALQAIFAPANPLAVTATAWATFDAAEARTRLRAQQLALMLYGYYQRSRVNLVSGRDWYLYERTGGHYVAVRGFEDGALGMTLLINDSWAPERVSRTLRPLAAELETIHEGCSSQQVVAGTDELPSCIDVMYWIQPAQ